MEYVYTQRDGHTAHSAFTPVCTTQLQLQLADALVAAVQLALHGAQPVLRVRQASCMTFTTKQYSTFMMAPAYTSTGLCMQWSEAEAHRGDKNAPGVWSY